MPLHSARSARKIRFQRQNSFDHDVSDDLEESTANLYCCQIHLKAGHDLSIKDSCGTSDPYVKFFHDGRMVHKSKTVYKDLNPVWDETFDLVIEDISVPLDLKVNLKQSITQS